MTGRVIEIRLTSPMPDFLQLLAQPELGIEFGDQSVGLMLGQSIDSGLSCSPRSPPNCAVCPNSPAGARWSVRSVSVQHRPEAADGFAQARDRSGGRRTIGPLPLASTGPLSRGNVGSMPLGLFGLDVRRAEGFLGSPPTAKLCRWRSTGRV